MQLEETNRELIDTRSELTTARSGASSPRVLLGVAPHACPAPPLSAASDLGSLRPSPLCVESGGGDRSAGGAAPSKLSPSHVSPSKQAQATEERKARLHEQIRARAAERRGGASPSPSAASAAAGASDGGGGGRRGGDGGGGASHRAGAEGAHWQVRRHQPDPGRGRRQAVERLVRGPVQAALG